MDVSSLDFRHKDDIMSVWVKLSRKTSFKLNLDVLSCLHVENTGHWRLQPTQINTFFLLLHFAFKSIRLTLNQRLCWLMRKSDPSVCLDGNRVMSWTTDREEFIHTKQLDTAELRVWFKHKASRVERSVMTRRTWIEKSHLSWIWVPHQDSSLFSVVFDNTALNDPSLANDTRKNHLSVHSCFSIFYQIDPPFRCCSFLPLSEEGSFCCPVCLALHNCTQMWKLGALGLCRGQDRLCYWLSFFREE